MFSAALAEEEDELIFRKASGSSGSMLAARGRRALSVRTNLVWVECASQVLSSPPDLPLYFLFCLK